MPMACNPVESGNGYVLKHGSGSLPLHHATKLLLVLTYNTLRGISLRVLTAYRLDDQSSISDRGSEVIFSVHHRVQTDSDTHSTSFIKGN
jgi:hypothetical protein